MNVWQTFWRNNVYERGPLIRPGWEGGWGGGAQCTMNGQGQSDPPSLATLSLPPPIFHFYLHRQTHITARDPSHAPALQTAIASKCLSNKKQTNKKNKRRRQQKTKGQTIFGAMRGTLYHLSPNTQRHPSNKGSSFLHLSGGGSARLNRSDCCYRSAASDGPQVNLGADERQDAVLLQPFSWTMIMTRHYWGQSPRGNETFCCHRPAFIRRQ